MILLNKIESEFIINHYYIVEHNNVRYIRTENIKTNDVTWEVTLLQKENIKPDDYETNFDEMEWLFNILFRKYKFEKILDENEI